MRPSKRKLLSMLLCVTLVLSLNARTAFAEAGRVTDSASTGGLCEHHTEHDDDCGYTEGTPETPCSHECSEESGCITETLNCTHEHDEACGYQPAVEGTPCGYVCALCESDDPEQKDGRKTFTVAQVEAMIDALPDVEYVEALDPEEDAENLEEIYLQAADAADAFDTLSDEDQEKVSNLDKLMELHEWFNGGVATMDESGMIASGTFKDSEGTEAVFTWKRYFIGDPVYKYTITKTGTGTGNMPDWLSPESVPWYGDSNYKENTKEVFIDDGVTSIGSCAFKNYPRLNSITIPASVETIGSEAFAHCGNISDTGVHVAFGENSKLKKLELNAFADTFLTSIEIPAGVTTIGIGAFQDCSSLSSITLPAGVKTIGNAAFYNCTGLTSIEIPAGVTTIGGGAFSYCTNLQTVTFKGTTPPAIDTYAFSDCNNITTINVPSGSEAAYSTLTNVFDPSLLPKQPSGGSDNPDNGSSDNQDSGSSDNPDNGSSDNQGSGSSDNSGDTGADNTAAPSDSYITYQILNGALSSWTPGSSEGLTIRGAGDFDKFTGVKVDGILLDRSNYTAEAGSTIVTFSAPYLSTLAAGNHTAQMLWTDGSATTTFTINANALGKKDDVPKTGDGTSIVWLFILAGISGTGLLLTGKKGKKNL